MYPAEEPSDRNDELVGQEITETTIDTDGNNAPVPAEIQQQLLFLKQQQQLQQQILLQQFHQQHQHLVDQHNKQIQEHMRLYFEHQKRMQEQERIEREKLDQERLQLIRNKEKHEQSKHYICGSFTFLKLLPYHGFTFLNFPLKSSIV